jgi:hypothetical protein
VKEYFKLQYKLLNRIIRDAGLDPATGYILGAIAFAGGALYLFSKTTFATAVFILIALSLQSRLSEIRRNDFLKLCFGDKQRKAIRVTENLVMSIPFLIFLLYKQLFLPAGVLLVASMILALLNFRSTLNFALPTPFYRKPFEFAVGFRSSYLMIFVAYALTVIAISVGNFNLGIFAMLLVFAITLNFYSKPEPEYYVWSSSQKPRGFLLDKTRTALLYATLLVLPIVVLLVIFFPQQVRTLLLFFIIGWGFLVCMIVSKYAAYPSELNISQFILMAVCMWFPPLLVLLIPYFFLKAERRLSRIL